MGGGGQNFLQGQNFCMPAEGGQNFFARAKGGPEKLMTADHG